MYNYYFASDDTDPLSTLCSNDDWEDLPVQMVVVSAGIKPRDDLARGTDIAVGERGGIVVDDQVSSS
jgi:nitrite reductase (NADH) large subunit